FAAHGIQILFALPSMVIATVFVSMPFVAREVVPTLREIGDEQEQAARTLGAGSWTTFWQITLPSIRWAVIYGVVLTTARSFGEFQALDDVSVDVAGDSLTALLGPSGSGKSTLLRIIAGLEWPDSGEIRLAGEDATALTPQKRGVGFVFQHYAAFKHMTVRENVAFGLKIRKQQKAAIKARVDELLEL